MSKGRQTKKSVYTTKEIADLVHVHVNTVRMYEKLGQISKAERKANGYRVFTSKHLDEMKLARLAFPGPYPVSSRSLFDMVHAFIEEDILNALKYAKQYKALVIEEQEKSRESLRTLDQWYKGQYGSERIIAVGRKAFAAINKVSVETIRSWERTGLYEPKVNSRRNKQYSEFDYEKVQIIRLLRKSGFSIESLYHVYHSDEEIKSPSYFLEKIYSNKESEYEADEWMKHIEDHIKRANRIIKFIEMKINNPPVLPH